VGRELHISYREDEGILVRLVALARLAARHPLRSARDLRHRNPDEPPLRALAPAALRLGREKTSRVHPLGGDEVQAVARRLGAVVGREASKTAGSAPPPVHR
jgi:hypothetical protein